jgi:DNA-binding transcriptional MerR regulator
MAERGRPLFSIGAVARMLELPPATIRTWESRYALVVPDRSPGGQRLYSREHVDQLRFVRDRLAEGRRPAEAHRLLSERLARGQPVGRPQTRVLLADGQIDPAELLRRLFGTEGFEVLLATTPEEAKAAFDELDPEIVVIDTNDTGLDELAARLRLARVSR